MKRSLLRRMIGFLKDKSVNCWTFSDRTSLIWEKEKVPISENLCFREVTRLITSRLRTWTKVPRLIINRQSKNLIGSKRIQAIHVKIQLRTLRSSHLIDLTHSIQFNAMKMFHQNRCKIWLVLIIEAITLLFTWINSKVFPSIKWIDYLTKSNLDLRCYV